MMAVYAPVPSLPSAFGFAELRVPVLQPGEAFVAAGVAGDV
jgi:hypothetical protein